MFVLPMSLSVLLGTLQTLQFRPFFPFCIFLQTTFRKGYQCVKLARIRRDTLDGFWDLPNQFRWWRMQQSDRCMRIKLRGRFVLDNFVEPFAPRKVWGRRTMPSTRLPDCCRVLLILVQMGLLMANELLFSAVGRLGTYWDPGRSVSKLPLGQQTWQRETQIMSYFVHDFWSINWSLQLPMLGSFDQRMWSILHVLITVICSGMSRWTGMVQFY